MTHISVEAGLFQAGRTKSDWEGAENKKIKCQNKIHFENFIIDGNFPLMRACVTIIAQKVFFETSDGVLSSIFWMLDSCQKKQIGYLATLREGIQHRKSSPVPAGLQPSLWFYWGCWTQILVALCLTEVQGKVEWMIRGVEELLCRENREYVVQPFPLGQD